MIGLRRWLAHRAAPAAIHDHFQAGLSPRRERALRAHLVECGLCRALYDCELLLEGEGAEAARTRRRRLGASLFPEAAARARVPRRAFALAAAVAVVLLAVLWLRPPQREPREKGGLMDGSRRVSVSIYRRGARGLVPAREAIESGQPLAFAYSNEAAEGYDRLLLFALDESWSVYWFYPAWTDPRAVPTGGFPIQRGADHELPDQVAHRYEGSRLFIVALFTRRHELGVREVEAAVEELRRRGERLERLAHFPLAGTGQHILSLRVRRP